MNYAGSASTTTGTSSFYRHLSAALSFRGATATMQSYGARHSARRKNPDDAIRVNMRFVLSLSKDERPEVQLRCLRSSLRRVAVLLGVLGIPAVVLRRLRKIE